MKFYANFTHVTSESCYKYSQPFNINHLVLNRIEPEWLQLQVFDIGKWLEVAVQKQCHLFRVVWQPGSPFTDLGSQGVTP